MFCSVFSLLSKLVSEHDRQFTLGFVANQFREGSLILDPGLVQKSIDTGSQPAQFLYSTLPKNLLRNFIATLSLGKYAQPPAPAYKPPGPAYKPYIPPPVSPELSDSIYYGQVTPKHHHHPATATPSTSSKPKSIHFGTHFGDNSIKSTSANPDIVSNTFRYNPTTSPGNKYDHTPSLVSIKHTGSTFAPTFPTLGRYSPFPQHFTTSSTPHFESTRIPPVHYKQITSTANYPTGNSFSSTPMYFSLPPKYHSPTTPAPKYYPTTTPTTKYYPTTTPSTIFYDVTTPTTESPIVQYSSTPAPTIRFPITTEPNIRIIPKSTPPPPPPPMPKFLPPPNKQHPTYFDVAKPVDPVPPPGKSCNEDNLKIFEVDTGKNL